MLMRSQFVPARRDGESLRDDSTLSDHSTFWWLGLPCPHTAHVCCPPASTLKAPAERKMRCQGHNLHKSACSLRTKMTMKLSSFSSYLSELPGRAGASPDFLSANPCFHGFSSSFLRYCVLHQKDNADSLTFPRDNTLFHFAGYLGSKENIIAYQLPCEY